MHLLPVYIILTTCFLLVQCFDNYNTKIFEETIKKNLRNSLGSSSERFSEYSSKKQSQFMDKLRKTVIRNKWTKVGGKKDSLNDKTLLGRETAVFENSPFSDLVRLGPFSSSQPSNTLQDSEPSDVLENTNQQHISAIDETTKKDALSHLAAIPRDVKEEIRTDSQTFSNSLNVIEEKNISAYTNVEYKVNFKDLLLNSSHSNHNEFLTNTSGKQKFRKPKWSEFTKFTIPLNNDINLNFNRSLGFLKISLESKNQTSIARSLMDSVTKMMKPSKGLSPMLPYVLVPALSMTGMLPWVLPGIRMAAGFVHMINRMAFTAGLFALIRAYIFNPKPDEHVVYVNNGYHPHGYGHSKEKLKKWEGNIDIDKIWKGV